MESVDEIVLRNMDSKLETRLWVNEIRFLCRYGDKTTWRATGTIMRYPEYGPSEMIQVFGDGDGVREAVLALEKNFKKVLAARSWGDSSVG